MALPPQQAQQGPPPPPANALHDLGLKCYQDLSQLAQALSEAHAPDGLVQTVGQAAQIVHKIVGALGEQSGQQASTQTPPAPQQGPPQGRPSMDQAVAATHQHMVQNRGGY